MNLRLNMYNSLCNVCFNPTLSAYAPQEKRQHME